MITTINDWKKLNETMVYQYGIAEKDETLEHFVDRLFYEFFRLCDNTIFVSGLFNNIEIKVGANDTKEAVIAKYKNNK